MGKVVSVPPSIPIILRKIDEILEERPITEGETDARKGKLKVLREVLEEVKQIDGDGNNNKYSN